MARRSGDGRAARARGFTYLGLLFIVAITGAALAALGQQWQTAAQRERERELEFRGRAIVRAIESYMAADPANPGRYPSRLDDLVVDMRTVRAKHHLRQLYADPFTGQADWVLIAPPGQPEGIRGVRSRSDRPLLRRLSESGETRASDWVFEAGGPLARPDPAASSPPQN